ncbi:hypothetical protein VF11_37620, partial [Nostoc linckia z14]
MGRWGDGEMGRWGDGEMGKRLKVKGKRNKFIFPLFPLPFSPYPFLFPLFPLPFPLTLSPY